MRNKDKKIIDKYMKKHPNASRKKIQKYAESKGIYVDVLTELEHQRIKEEIQDIVGMGDDEINNVEKFNEALENLSEEKQQQLMNLKRGYEKERSDNE